MNDCCRKAADEYFYSAYPFASFHTDEPLLTHLLEIAKDWGDLLAFIGRAVLHT